MNKFPAKAPELFQYKFNIREAAGVYVWDNVYRYDICFRELIGLSYERPILGNNLKAQSEMRRFS